MIMESDTIYDFYFDAGDKVLITMVMNTSDELAYGVVIDRYEMFDDVYYIVEADQMFAEDIGPLPAGIEIYGIKPADGYQHYFVSADELEPAYRILELVKGSFNDKRVNARRKN